MDKQKLLDIVLQCRKSEQYHWMSITTLEEYMDIVITLVSEKTSASKDKENNPKELINERNWIGTDYRFKTGIKIGNFHLYGFYDENFEFDKFLWEPDDKSLYEPKDATKLIRTYNSAIYFHDNWNSDSIEKRRNDLGELKTLRNECAKNEAEDLKRLFKNELQGAMHIIIDNIDRLPYSIIPFDNEPWNNKTYPNYKYNLQRLFLTKAEEHYAFMLEVITKSIKYSLQYHNELFPHFYKEKREIQYALPLFFTGSKYADCVLILGREDGKELVFVPKTILTPKMYNKDIRVFNPSYEGINWLKREE